MRWIIIIVLVLVLLVAIGPRASYDGRASPLDDALSLLITLAETGAPTAARATSGEAEPGLQ